MSEQNPVAVAEVVPEDPSLLEDRRLRVQAMKLRRLSTRAIAAVLNESVQTIEADLAWLQQSHASRYGSAPSIDPSQEIGWAVADFEEMESVAWLEFHALKQEAQQRKMSPMYVARARQGWIRTAAMMRVLRLKLLGEHGYLLPSASTKTVGSSIPRADDLRQMLRQEGLLLEVIEANGSSPKHFLTNGNGDEAHDEAADDFAVVDPVAAWMDDGGWLGGA